ncbi:hypothetical protein BKA56DRAFT_201456 [Ilyonectria sp. MPI-CAGE-AT-0026]|nr:hypothetical protein BKA56DRAFT_201456 [Ilyonectria sp. MPI-CAGE-AT-0026]
MHGKPGYSALQKMVTILLAGHPGALTVQVKTFCKGHHRYSSSACSPPSQETRTRGESWSGRASSATTNIIPSPIDC